MTLRSSFFNDSLKLSGMGGIVLIRSLISSGVEDSIKKVPLLSSEKSRDKLSGENI